jgi:long-chain acyl-CoA synthetase
MSSLQDWAARRPDDLALAFLPSGERLSFAELAGQANAAADWLIAHGLAAGDSLAVMLENRSEIVMLGFAARRAGLYYTPLSVHLQEREIGHMLRDCGARVLVVSAQTAALAQRVVAMLDDPAAMCVVSVDAGCGDWPVLAALLDGRPRDGAALPPRPLGRDQLYSSGTTGLPRAIRKPLAPWESRDQVDREVASWRQTFGFDEHAVYFSAAPLYHAAPLRYAMRTLDCGGRCVLQQKFEPAEALQALTQWQVTHSQWVPTMFVRLLALPAAQRAALTPRQLVQAIHSAAPCPVHVKRAMIDWWGPILYEYYAGTEGLGLTAIDSAEWLARPGSVGTAKLGQVRIVGDDGAVLPAGEIGQVFFEGGPDFLYLNDPQKTAAARNAQGWATYGDIGHLDADGYLFLSDRRADLILSGGVNIYPREIEDVLMAYPAVEDVGVVGVPDAEFGEAVKAVVRLRQPVPAGAAQQALAQELIAHCRAQLSRLKAPRSIDFVDALPRMENGKLLRRLLKERYRQPASAH